MNYQDFLGRFERKSKTSRGFMVRCPGHEDSIQKPSLSISEGQGGEVLLKCFAGCSAEQVVASMGLKMSDLFPEKLSRGPRILPKLDRTPKVESSPVGELEKTYPYLGADGVEVYQVLRYKPKTFRQRHQKNGIWVNNMDGVERVLYHLPEVLAAETVWVCEGEKDADNLTALGYVATCNVGGAGKWLDSYTDSLTGKNIILCGDNDEPGRKHISLVFDSLAGKVRTVTILKLPNEVKDVSDFIRSFQAVDEAKLNLDALVKSTFPHIKGIKLPIRTVSELEDGYKKFVQDMEHNSFSLGKWLPSFRKLRPLVPGEFVVVIGDTGVGKTGILQQIGVAALPLPTLMFSMELPDELMFERLVAQTCKLTCDVVEKNYRDCPTETLKYQLDEKLKNLFICTESKLSIEKIENYINRAELKMGERPKVVLLDYLQLIGADGPTRREKMSDIAEELKVMAKSTKTIIIAASQVRRDPEHPEPGLHSAKESGSIESSCGLLIGAWWDKDGVYNLKVLKSTKGGAGLHIPCNFDGARMTIVERSKISDKDIPNYEN